MNNKESRLYAIACRAPLTQIHLNKIEEPEDYKQALEYYHKMVDAFYEKASDLKLPTYGKHRDAYFDVIRIKDIHDYFDFGKHSWYTQSFKPKWKSDWILGATWQYRTAQAALAYAKEVVDTPYEQVVLTLPVNEDISRAILAGDNYKQAIANFYNTEYNYTPVLEAVRAILEEHKQEQQKALTPCSPESPVQSEVICESKRKVVEEDNAEKVSPVTVGCLVLAFVLFVLFITTQ